MFSGAKGDAGKIPCVGISFGVERLFSLLSAKAATAQEGRGKPTQVFVMSIGEGLIEDRMKVVAELWAAGIKVRRPFSPSSASNRSPALRSTHLTISPSFSQAEFTYKVKPKTAAQFEVIDKDRIPFAVMVAPDELKQGMVRIKEQVGKEEGQNKGELVSRGEMIEWLSKRLRA